MPCMGHTMYVMEDFTRAFKKHPGPGCGKGRGITKPRLKRGRRKR